MAVNVYGYLSVAAWSAEYFLPNENITKPFAFAKFLSKSKNGFADW